MIWRKLFLLAVGGCYGLLSAAGVFTVLAAVGLIPRFAGRTHTADHAMEYETMVILGSIGGCLVSVFPENCGIGSYLRTVCPGLTLLWEGAGQVFLSIAGLSCGMFVGCLALAIAEMLDSIPIFARRISFQKGLPWVVLSMALGKLAGSLLYFFTEFHRTAG